MIAPIAIDGNVIAKLLLQDTGTVSYDPTETPLYAKSGINKSWSARSDCQTCW